MKLYKFDYMFARKTFDYQLRISLNVKHSLTFLISKGRPNFQIINSAMLLDACSSFMLNSDSFKGGSDQSTELVAEISSLAFKAPLKKERRIFEMNFRVADEFHKVTFFEKMSFHIR